MINNKNLAFTLAEVLITLGIIGIVAALTIPSLLSNIQQKDTIVKVKKAYSILSQATTLAVKDNGTPDSWSTYGNATPQGATDIKNIYVPYLKPIKNCDADVSCYPVWSYLNSTTTFSASDSATLQLLDGSIWTFRKNPSAGSVSGTGPLANPVAPINVDINGFKPPNMYGKDAFRFILTASGQIIPSGVPDDTNSFSNTCQNFASSNVAGQSCTAWIIYNENMDYLKPCGTTLSWTGPTSCN